MKNAPYATEIETADQRAITLAGAGQMIHEDEFGALAALLVDCGAVPRNVMAVTLRRLADARIAAARAQLDSGSAIYPAGLFDRARSLAAMAAGLERGARDVGARQ